MFLIDAVPKWNYRRARLLSSRPRFIYQKFVVCSARRGIHKLFQWISKYKKSICENAMCKIVFTVLFMLDYVLPKKKKGRSRKVNNFVTRKAPSI